MGFFRIVIHFKEESLVEPKVIDPKYHTRVIITRSRFETALDYKPRILGPTFLVYVLNYGVCNAILSNHGTFCSVMGIIMGSVMEVR